MAGDQKQDIDPELLQACPQVGTVETEIVPNNFVYDLGKYSKTAIVSGDINMDGANRAANTIVFRDSSDNRDVFLSIASGGGDPIAARSVIDAIDETPNQVVARITGQASSAAALIGVYADVVFASQNARMVLHPPYVSRIDSNHVSLKDFREYAAFLEEGIEFSVEIYKAAHSSITEGCARHFARDKTDVTLTAELALRVGFVDAVLLDYEWMRVRKGEAPKLNTGDNSAHQEVVPVASP